MNLKYYFKAIFFREHLADSKFELHQNNEFRNNNQFRVHKD